MNRNKCKCGNLKQFRSVMCGECRNKVRNESLKKKQVCECGSQKGRQSKTCRECYIKKKATSRYSKCRCGKLKKTHSATCKKCHDKNPKAYKKICKRCGGPKTPDARLCKDCHNEKVKHEKEIMYNKKPRFLNWAAQVLLNEGRELNLDTISKRICAKKRNAPSIGGLSFHIKRDDRFIQLENKCFKLAIWEKKSIKR